MENKILRKLSKKGPTDFMILRAELPFTSEVPSSYNNLLKLNLIEEKRSEKDIIIQLTLEGVEASHKGIEKWAENKLLEEIKKREFFLTKETTEVELKALRNLEDNGEVYEVEKSKYKVVPGKSLYRNSNLGVNRLTKIENSGTKQRKAKKNGEVLIKVLAWLVMAIIGILAILEPEYQYVTDLWREITAHFK